MECNWVNDLPCLPGAEQDFPLGAKATSCLPSATELDHVFDNDTFELPDWLESRENLGLSNIELFDDSKFKTLELFDNSKFKAMDSAVNYQFNEEITKFEEEYSETIKPEDMLVPLSELKSETYTPQGIGANTLSAPTTTFPNYSSVLTTSSNPTASSIPKILIRVNKVQVAIPKQQNRTRGLANVQPSFEISGMQLQNSSRLQERSVELQSSRLPERSELQNCNNVQILEPQYSSHLQIQQVQNSDYHQIDNASNSNTDELFSQLVEMAGNEPNALTNLISTFDSSVIQAGMDDLLSQLDSSDSQPELLDVSPWSSAPASPVSVPSPVPASPISVPSPVPSFGSLSPLSTDERSFHQQLTPTYTIDDAAIQPECSKSTSFLSLWSPSTEDSMSVSSPSLTCEDESDGGYSKSEIHSYSRSPLKRKANPRSSAYPEGRKERKKEQNKQAALRYRHKKKQEDDEIMSIIEEEEEKQKQLQTKYKDLKQELTYMKKIMREVLIAQGTLPAGAFKKAKKT